MRLSEVEVLGRERFGSHVLIRYVWDGAVPEPGQFVMARPVGSNFDPFLSRPFFVHDFEDGVASLLFEVRGVGTAILAGEGVCMRVSQPLGRGFDLVSAEVTGPAALVGGGVWVAPLKLLSRHLALREVEHAVFLEVPATAHGAYAELLSWTYPTATLVPTGGSPDTSRLVLDHLGDLDRYSVLYVSGPDAVLAAARDACAGRVPAQLALRERMACADGSCYGCAVPVRVSGVQTYARACIEGPVFPAEVLRSRSVTPSSSGAGGTWGA